MVRFFSFEFHRALPPPGRLSYCPKASGILLETRPLLSTAQALEDYTGQYGGRTVDRVQWQVSGQR